MTSTKPYLLRAIYEWCVDNGFTPYLQVAVDARTQVPRQHVKDGQIVLNLSTEATNSLLIGNDAVSFQARFSGAVFSVMVPVDAVAAIFARENGMGMHFDVTPAVADTSEDATTTAPEPPPTNPRLSRVK
jgi:stringent starvation protein B